mmetsp:Transcript_108261/g.323765  ORF Transcript_108261/g.323765 Transcript_108261/m.323765 type:complete len:279 (-) Transcript_108261:7-843(-)
MDLKPHIMLSRRTGASMSLTVITALPQPPHKPPPPEAVHAELRADELQDHGLHLGMLVKLPANSPRASCARRAPHSRTPGARTAPPGSPRSCRTTPRRSRAAQCRHQDAEPQPQEAQDHRRHAHAELPAAELLDHGLHLRAAHEATDRGEPEVVHAVQEEEPLEQEPHLRDAREAAAAPPWAPPRPAPRTGRCTCRSRTSPRPHRRPPATQPAPRHPGPRHARGGGRGRAARSSSQGLRLRATSARRGPPCNVHRRKRRPCREAPSPKARYRRPAPTT